MNFSSSILIADAFNGAYFLIAAYKFHFFVTGAAVCGRSLTTAKLFCLFSFYCTAKMGARVSTGRTS